MNKLLILSIFFLSITCKENKSVDNKKNAVNNSEKQDFKIEVLKSFSKLLDFYEWKPDSMLSYEEFISYNSLEQAYVNNFELTRREEILLKILQTKKHLIIGDITQAKEIVTSIPDTEEEAVINHLFIKGIVYKFNMDEITSKTYFKKTIQEFEKNSEDRYCRIYQVSKVLTLDRKFNYCKEYEKTYDSQKKLGFKDLIFHSVLTKNEL
jgi:hypothetical protein